MTGPVLTVSTSELANGVTVVTAAGSIDAKTAPECQEPAMTAIVAGRSVVLDLTDVTYTSSAGLRMLLLLHRHALANNTRLVLAGLGDDVASVMDATGFLDSFTVSSSVPDALETLT